MIERTLDAVRAVLKTEPILTPADIAQIVANIRNRGREVAPPRAAVVTEKRILTRRDVAQRFHRSPRFVDRLATEGIIHRVTLPGRKRTCGFLSEEVERVMGGEGVEV